MPRTSIRCRPQSTSAHTGRNAFSLTSGFPSATLGERVGGLEASLPPERHLLLRRANQIRTIQGSLAIAGNTLSLDQVTVVVAGSLTNTSFAGILHAP